jgi:hypothetical protein
MTQETYTGKHLIGGLLTVSEGGFTATMIGTMAAGRQGIGAVAEPLLLFYKHDPERKGAMREQCWLLRPHLLVLFNSSTSWGQFIQRYINLWEPFSNHHRGSHVLDHIHSYLPAPMITSWAAGWTCLDHDVT